MMRVLKYVNNNFNGYYHLLNNRTICLFMKLGLENKRILITGSSRGIGLGIAKNFLLEGAKVCISSRNKKQLKDAKDLLSKSFDEKNILAVNCDFTNVEEIKKLKNIILEKWNALDIVIANIGDGDSSIESLPDDRCWSRTWSSNFDSALFTSRVFLPVLEQNKGNLLFISSIAGVESIGAPVDYSTAKTALIALSKNMARKLGGKVRVNVLAPGNIFFNNGVWDKKLKANPDAVKSYIQSNVPMNRFGEIQDIANTALFICSEKSSFTTGSVFVVDGGQTHSL